MSDPTDSGHGLLTDSVATIVDASTATDARVVTHATFYNAHTVAVTVTVYYLRSGESSASDGAIVAKKTIPPLKTWIALPLLGQPIRQSAYIQAVAGVTDVVHYNIGVNVG